MPIDNDNFASWNMLHKPITQMMTQNIPMVYLYQLILNVRKYNILTCQFFSVKLKLVKTIVIKYLM
jgi:hypothetical protein